jgi:hypothetical protein
VISINVILHTEGSVATTPDKQQKDFCSFIKVTSHNSLTLLSNILLKKSLNIFFWHQKEKTKLTI